MKETLELALEALEKLARLGNGEHYGNSDGNMIARAAITAIKAALAQPAQELTNIQRHEQNVQKLFGTAQPAQEPMQTDSLADIGAAYKDIHACLTETLQLSRKQNGHPCQPAQEPVFCEYCGGNDENPPNHCMDCARPQEPDYDALSQKQLASLKRDTRISLEDAAVRATHKVMAKLGEETMKDEDDDIQVYQRHWVGLTDEDQFNLVHAMNENDWDAVQMMDAIEAKLKEKNT
jgi:hypothetical protein